MDGEQAVVDIAHGHAVLSSAAMPSSALRSAALRASGGSGLLWPWRPAGQDCDARTQ